MVGDLRLIAVAVFGLLQADHHQILKEVLSTGVPLLLGGAVRCGRAYWLCGLWLFNFYRGMERDRDSWFLVWMDVRKLICNKSLQDPPGINTE